MHFLLGYFTSENARKNASWSHKNLTIQPCESLSSLQINTICYAIASGAAGGVMSPQSLVSLTARFVLRLVLVIPCPRVRVFLGSSILLARHLLAAWSTLIALNFSVSLCHAMALIHRPFHEATRPLRWLDSTLRKTTTARKSIRMSNALRQLSSKSLLVYTWLYWVYPTFEAHQSVSCANNLGSR